VTSVPLVRRGHAADLPAVETVQEASPDAAQWPVSDYLGYDFRVAEAGSRIVGFLVGRTLAEGEREVLNVAVAPEFRRRGVARQLVESFLMAAPGAVYLEVRELNIAARYLYKSMGFQEVSARPGYYASIDGSSETAIVMKFHSC
jgi:ribosomal-protein-alanine N-acetyltransferase